jgi:hypothetical protein
MLHGAAGETTIEVSVVGGGGSTADHAKLLELGQLLAEEIKAATSGVVVPTVSVSDATANAATSAVNGAPQTTRIQLVLDPIARRVGVSRGAGTGRDSPAAAAALETYSLHVMAFADGSGAGAPTSGGGGGPGTAVVTSGSYGGMVAGTATLLQAVVFGADTDAAGWTTPQNCSTLAEWRLPVIAVVDDTPALPYRGAMVDAAREYLPLSALKGYVIMCRSGTFLATFAGTLSAAFSVTFQKSHVFGPVLGHVPKATFSAPFLDPFSEAFQPTHRFTLTSPTYVMASIGCWLPAFR